MLSPDNTPAPNETAGVDGGSHCLPIEPSGASIAPGGSAKIDKASTPNFAVDAAEINAALSFPVLTEDIEDAPFWKEVVAYAKMSSMELDSYQGKFIAVYQGNIVDSDADEAELALRFYRVFGYVPVYIHAVGLEDDVIDVLD